MLTLACGRAGSGIDTARVRVSVAVAPPADLQVADGVQRLVVELRAKVVHGGGSGEILDEHKAEVACRDKRVQCVRCGVRAATWAVVIGERGRGGKGRRVEKQG